MIASRIPLSPHVVATSVNWEDSARGAGSESRPPGLGPTAGWVLLAAKGVGVPNLIADPSLRVTAGYEVSGSERGSVIHPRGVGDLSSTTSDCDGRRARTHGIPPTPVLGCLRGAAQVSESRVMGRT